MNWLDFGAFLVFGTLFSAMIAVTDFPTALAVFLAYCNGGLVMFGLTSPNMKKGTS